MKILAFFGLIGLCFFSCSSKPTATTPETAEAFMRQDTVVFGNGADSLWVWWSDAYDLNGDDQMDHGLVVYPGPTLSADTLRIEYFTDSLWTTIDNVVLIKGHMSALLPQVTPAGNYDLRLTWIRHGSGQTIIANGAEFPVLLQAPLKN